MQSWIKENPITSILVGAVILLVLFSGFQYYQISELHADQTEVRDYLENDLYQHLLDTTAFNSETDKRLDVIFKYHYESEAHQETNREAILGLHIELDSLSRRLSGNLNGAMRMHLNGYRYR